MANGAKRPDLTLGEDGEATAESDGWNQKNFPTNQFSYPNPPEFLVGRLDGRKIFQTKGTLRGTIFVAEADFRSPTP